MQDLIDTHAHLCDPSFDADRSDVIERAEKAGVGRIICVGETLADAKQNLALARRYPQVLPAAGLYPAIPDRAQAEAMYALIRRERARLVAIGEVGLDFWVAREDANRAIQREIFSGFIDLSVLLGLPLNVHSRSAGHHAVALLLEKGARRVQLHAFDGRVGAALPAVEAGFFFSIPPSVVRSRQKQKLLRQLPLSSLLLETDSPVLGASPDERNEPARLPLVIDAICKIKNIGREEVIRTVSENTRRLYGEKIFTQKSIRLVASQE